MFPFSRLIRSVPKAFIPSGIIFCSMLLATYWVFLVPIFQSPDEDVHADYVFTLYSKKKLVKAKSATIVACSHPYTRYLFDVTNGQAVKVLRFGQLPTNYGTKAFFQQIDAHAPSEEEIAQCKTNTATMIVYTFPYYALIASGLGVLSLFSNHLSFLFFSVRCFSVILFGCGLAFSYLTMLELGLSKLKSSLILTAIAFFPMVTSVASYIQPDNLSLVAVSAAFYLALRWRNNYFRTENVTLWLLGLTMALLLIKYQFFVCVGIPILAMVITQSIRSKISFQRLALRLLILLGPATIIGIIQAWIIWGSQLPADEHHWHWHPTYYTFQGVLTQGGEALNTHIFTALFKAYICIYWVGGRAFKTFWGCFGHHTIPLIIVNPAITDALTVVCCCVTQIIILLTLISLAKVLFSLYRVLKKRGIGSALYLACANPVINSYFLFVILMFVFFVIAYPSVLWQGRHWYALIFALFLNTVCFSPRVFSSRLIRERIFYVITIAWLFYSLIGSYFAIGCVRDRYYSQREQPYLNTKQLENASIPGSNWIDHVEFLERYPTFDIHPKDGANILKAPLETDIWIEGTAIDINAGSLASAVFLYVDGNKMYRATYGLSHLNEEEKFRFCGFGVLIPAKELGPGIHSLTMKFVSADKRTLYSTNQIIKIIIK